MAPAGRLHQEDAWLPRLVAARAFEQRLIFDRLVGAKRGRAGFAFSRRGGLKPTRIGRTAAWTTAATATAANFTAANATAPHTAIGRGARERRLVRLTDQDRSQQPGVGVGRGHAECILGDVLVVALHALQKRPTLGRQPIEPGGQGLIVDRSLAEFFFAGVQGVGGCHDGFAVRVDGAAADRQRAMNQLQARRGKLAGEELVELHVVRADVRPVDGPGDELTLVGVGGRRHAGHNRQLGGRLQHLKLRIGDGGLGRGHLAFGQRRGLVPRIDPAAQAIARGQRIVILTLGNGQSPIGDYGCPLRVATFGPGQHINQRDRPPLDPPVGRAVDRFGQEFRRAQLSRAAAHAFHAGPLAPGRVELLERAFRLAFRRLRRIRAAYGPRIFGVDAFIARRVECRRRRRSLGHQPRRALLRPRRIIRRLGQQQASDHPRSTGDHRQFPPSAPSPVAPVPVVPAPGIPVSVAPARRQPARMPGPRGERWATHFGACAVPELQ